MAHEYFSYIIFLILTLCGASLFCVGLFESTKGSSTVTPEGDERIETGMILYPIARFLSKTKDVPIFYCGWRLENLYDQIKCDFRVQGDLLTQMKLMENEILLSTLEDLNLWELLMCDIKKKYKIEGYIQDNRILFFETYDEPIFSEWWTKPLLLCYKCYASIWGTLIYVLSVSLAVKLSFIKFDLSILIPLWLVYVFSLVTVNTYVYKKIS